MRRVQTGLWLFATCMLAAVPAPATETADEAYLAAIATGTAGDPSAAGEPLRAILAAHPHLVRVRRALAVIDDYEAGRVDSDMAALVLDGQRLIERQEWSKAEQTLSAAVERNPEYFVAWHDLGRARFERGRVRDALVAYETALRLQPDYPYSLNNLGLTYWRLGDRERALDPVRRALEVDPSYCNAHNTLGWILRTLGREDEAREAFKKAQALCPGDPWPEANLAWHVPLAGESNRTDARPPGASRADHGPPTGVLVQRLTSRRAETRTAAAERLMGRRDPAALPAVLKLLDHRRDTVRSAAGRVLGAYRDHELVQPLTRVAEGDRAWVVRQEAIRALGLLPAESATPTLVRSLTSDKAYQVRHAAVLALCSSAGCPVARALQAAMKDRAVEVRGAARYCLARLGAAQPPSDPVALEDWVAGWCTDTPGITQ